MNKPKQLAITLGIMAFMTLAIGFMLRFLHFDKPVSFVNMLMLIGGMFAGFSIGVFIQYRKRDNKIS